MLNLRGAYFDIIAERRRGLFFDLVRLVLALASLPYAAVVVLRNLYYDLLRCRAQRAERPVISIGNLTTGGTGKTPVTAHLASMLVERQKAVTILLRGYKASRRSEPARGENTPAGKWSSHSDEALVLKRRCPRAIVIVDPDRTVSARKAVSEGAGVILLDDGFQHRRLARDLDIVLVDATLPFGYGHILPRGLLREPASSLRRAGLIIVTRSDEIDHVDKGVLLGTLRRVSGGKPVIEAVHAPAGFSDVKGRAVDPIEPGDVQAVIFAGIANFESFRRTVEKLGVRVLAAYQFPDHHDYSDDEIAGLQQAAQDLEANSMLTTEKDAVKLVGRWEEDAVRLLVLGLEIVLADDGIKVLNDALDNVLRE